MRNAGIRIKCCKCGVTDRIQDPLMFAVDGWCIDKDKAFCPRCCKIYHIAYDYDKFMDYFKAGEEHD